MPTPTSPPTCTVMHHLNDRCAKHALHTACRQHVPHSNETRTPGPGGTGLYAPVPPHHHEQDRRGDDTDHARHQPETTHPPPAEATHVLETMANMSKEIEDRFFNQAQTRVGEFAPPASGIMITSSANAKPANYGMVEEQQPKDQGTEDWSAKTASHFATTGNYPMGANPQATTSGTSVLAVERRTMELRTALEQRRSKVVSPYKHNAWSAELTRLGLLAKHPDLVDGLRSGFDLGIPYIFNTYIPPNNPSVIHLPNVYSSTVENEFAAGRYIGPFSRRQLEAEVGPFQTSPLSFIPKVSKPRKYRAIHNFSFPHNPSPDATSINSHINSEDFPCTWGTFATVVQIITHLPPRSQASVRDVAEVYRTIPARPSQWPGLVIRLQEEDQYAVNTCNNFGLTSAGGIYGMVAAAGADIFRGNGIGPVAKWVDDHIFFRVPRERVNIYPNIILPVLNGIMRSIRREVVNRKEADYGTGGKTSQTAPQRNLMKTAAFCSRTWLKPPPAVHKTKDFPMLMWTSMPFQGTWESDGKPPSPSHSEQKFPTWVSSGTCTHAQSACWKRKGLNTWQQSQNGRRNKHTFCRKYRNRTGNSNTRPWSSIQDALTSPARRPCSPPAIIALSFHAPHPETPPTIWNGGDNGSVNQIAPDPSQNPDPSSTTKPTLMQAPSSESQSQLAQDGGLGAWPQDGSPKAGTSNGLKQLDLSSSSSTCYHFPIKATISRYMATTEVSSKGGGKDPATTSQPTGSSGGSWSYQRATAGLYTQDTSRAQETLLTLPQGAVTPHTNYSSKTLMSQGSSTPSSSASTTNELARRAVLKRMLPAFSQGGGNPVDWLEPKRHKPPEPSQHQPRVQTAASAPKTPAPYQQKLTPVPSHCRPHCLARDRLRQWIPAHSHTKSSPTSLSEAEHERIKDTMLHAWEEDTREVYGAGLLMWHCFCNDRDIPEQERAPASQTLLSAFVAHMAAAYLGKTISNYLHGVRAWHALHSIPWQLDKPKMDTMLRAAEKLTPTSSKRKKRRPYTPNFIAALKQQMNLEDPLDAAVFACLTTCFYATARLGEFTVRTLQSFNPNTHITMRNLSYDQDHNGLKVTALHLPRTKTAGNEGEDVYWASQDGDSDPTTALQNHFRVNQPSKVSHLFAYQAKHARKPLTKAKFLDRVGKAAHAAGLEPLQGHGIRIGSTLEYLLRGVPFNVMKAKGRWAGDSFLLYLRKHAVIIAPYIQAAPAIHETFIRYSMPPVR